MPGEIKFSQLPTGTSIVDADISPWVQSGTNVKQSASAVDTFIEGKIANAGNRYLSNTAYSTDNLLSAPNFTALKTETDNHIADLNNPHQTTVQQVYDQNNTVTLDNGALTFNNASGIQQATITTKGSAIHLPIYSLASSQSLTLGAVDIDTVYINSASSTGNVLNIQHEVTAIYADNATFYANNNGTQILSVVAASGVTLNGVSAGSISVALGAIIEFSRIALNTWESNIVSLAAGSGISIDSGGTITTSGSGPTAAYAYMSVQNLATTTSFTDSTTWKPLVGTILSSMTNNFLADNDTPSDPTTPFYLQYIGADTAVFEISSCFGMRRFSSTTANGYYISGSFDAINPFSGTFGDQQLSYGLDGQNTANSKNIAYANQISMSTNDKLYFVVQNGTSGSTTTDNDFLNTDQIITIQKIGDIGGVNAGVASLNGETGNIDIISSDGSISISDSMSMIDLSTNLPVSTSAASIAIISGASAVSPSSSLIFSTQSTTAGMVQAVLKTTVTSDGSGDLIKLAITAPFATTFTTAAQAMPISSVVTPTASLGSPGALGSGALNQLFADTVNQWIEVDIETALINTAYTVWISMVYQL